MPENIRRLLINAVGVRAGGGPTVALAVLGSIRAVAPELEVRALIPDRADYIDVCKDSDFEYVAYDTNRRGYHAWRLWFDQFAVNANARAFGADAIFSLGNQGPVRPCVPHVILFMNPYYIYAEHEWGPGWSYGSRLSLRAQRIVFRRASRAAHIAVQTDVAASRLRSVHKVPAERVHVVPPAVAEANLGDLEAAVGEAIRARAAGRIVVGTPSRYYPHKQIEMVIACAARLRQQGDDRFLFVLSISAADHAGASALLQRIEQDELSDRVLNVGFVPLRELRGMYSAMDVMLLPTLLESFSSAYMEAMALGVPVVTSDLDFARAACGVAAVYVEPGDPAAWVKELQRMADHPEVRAEMSIAGRARMTEFGDYEAVTRAYLAVIARAVSEHGGHE